jgi:hypothetical protein
MQDIGFITSLLIVGTSFPLAFWSARACLVGVLRVLERGSR